MTSNLQIALISQRIELLGRDWTQMEDFLKLFPDLTNFSYLSFTKVRLFVFIGELRLMLYVVSAIFFRLNVMCLTNLEVDVFGYTIVPFKVLFFGKNVAPSKIMGSCFSFFPTH